MIDFYQNLEYTSKTGRVAELVYAHDSKSCEETRVGSSPTTPTN